ncbi:MAG: hypothetical protein Q8Q90_00335, partial [bacterium]|nr:hypothetical protein [bacterium]
NIDRSCPFDPVSFEGFGNGWSLGAEDERSLKLTEINPAEILLETCFKNKEKIISGNERVKRLKDIGLIRLDIGVFRTFWENRILVPKRWKRKENGRVLFVCFDGTELHGPNGHIYTVCLFWSGVLRWSYFRLDGPRGYSNDPSAVLK